MLSSSVPAAQASPGAEAATFSSRAALPPVVAAGTSVHAVPFQCLIVGVPPSAPSALRPTAQASLAPVEATSQNSVETVSLSGVASCQGVAARAARSDAVVVAVPVAAFAGAPDEPSAIAHTATAMRSPAFLAMVLLLLGWCSQKEMAAGRRFLQVTLSYR
ncbi:hypothetical protein SAZ11_39505 [Streptomyces sp. FXJ1.4098]|nr:hypothetical protein [Streptomyces sp. FXJ1.4098]